MIPLSRVIESTGGTLIRGGGENFSSVVIDGRAATPGALFFAVKGENHDGHDFVPQAIASGAAAVVVARGRNVDAPSVIEVDDTVAALGKLARAHREVMTNLKVVAVTGSNGKTTTKDMIASILSASGAPVLKTEGNLNNHLGVPLMLLRLDESHRYAVIEMGMSGLGEIDYLQGLARPHVAVVVCIAPVHLEQLGTIENVARAKAEIWNGGALAVAPIDEPLLKSYYELPHAEGGRVPREAAKNAITFGPRALAPSVGYDRVEAGPDGVRFTMTIAGLTSMSGVTVTMPALVGAHNAIDACAAAAAARALEIGEAAILDGLASVRPAKHRAQLLKLRDRTILDDCYNASPLSTRAALEALVSVAPKGKRIAVLGDMRELGPDSAKLHVEVGAYAATRADALIAFGSESRHTAAAARMERVFHTEDVEAAVARVLDWSGPGDVILIKASRGMKLERIIDALVERLG